MNATLKRILPYALSVIVMIVISVVYFSPDIFENRVLFQGDIQQGIAIGEEGRAFKEATGESTRWTNSLFGGMPNFQISPSYSNNAVIKVFENIFSLGLPSPVSYIFIMMLGFYILMVVLKVKWHIALIGAVAYAFSSYFFIIIAAGHIWKFITLAYIPPTIAGVILAYRGKYLAGAAIAALFGMMQIVSNHVQMSYYFGIFILALIVSYGVEAYRSKTMPRFYKATASLLVAAALAVSANLPNIYNTYEYAKVTMRGQSELVSPSEGASKSSSNSGGLSLDYITQWSYGVGESWTLLIPNVKGGATGALASNKEAMSESNSSMRQYMAQMNQYWGNQPFTSGPVYAGAVVMFLFFLGCFTLKGALKWASIAAIIVSLMLSWGHNFMPLTEWFVNNVPLYNKFRTVSSILVVAEFCIPLIAILALKEIIANPKQLKEQPKKLYIPLALTAGISLIFALMPSLFFSFLSTQEVAFAAESADYKPIFDELERIRETIFTADAMRTFWFIVVAFAIILLYINNKIKSGAVVLLIGLTILFDMYGVNKRYLSSKNFVADRVKENPFPKSPADIAILQDKDPNYRVLNLATDTYNDPHTSYYHKSIGGYSAAKLRRYDDIIKYQLSQNNIEVINMLNAKYFITPDESGVLTAYQNPDALGNAWFVSDIMWVDGAAEEMAALREFNAETTAIVDKHFNSVVPQTIAAPQQGDTIYLTSYKPNELQYRASTQNGAFAVFSEIYFPWGWSITVDGKEVEMAQVNYILRGLDIPAGEHTVVFKFDPKSLHITTTIAFIAIALIILLCIAAVMPKSKLIKFIPKK